MRPAERSIPSLVLIALLLAIGAPNLALAAPPHDGFSEERPDVLAQRRRRRPRGEEAPAPAETPAEEPQEAAQEPEPEAPPAEGERAAGVSLRRSNHMEFDARLVRGQTAGSGAVVLFERVQRPLAPLVRQRTTFLEPTVQPVIGERAPEAAPIAAPTETPEATAPTPTPTEVEQTPAERRRTRRERRRNHSSDAPEATPSAAPTEGGG